MLTRASAWPSQTSLLMTYEGMARSLTDARPAVHLIDFAHAFPSGSSSDVNFLGGLNSLISIITPLGCPISQA